MLVCCNFLSVFQVVVQLSQNDVFFCVFILFYFGFDLILLCLNVCLLYFCALLQNCARVLLFFSIFLFVPCVRVFGFCILCLCIAALCTVSCVAIVCVYFWFVFIFGLCVDFAFSHSFRPLFFSLSLS